VVVVQRGPSRDSAGYDDKDTTTTTILYTALRAGVASMRDDRMRLAVLSACLLACLSAWLSELLRWWRRLRRRRAADNSLDQLLGLCGVEMRNRELLAQPLHDLSSSLVVRRTR